MHTSTRLPVLRALALTSVLVLAGAACDDKTSQVSEPPDDPNNDCAAGALGCACKPDNTCDEGLTCINALCIPDDDPNNDPNPDPNNDPDPDPNNDPNPPNGLGLAIGQGGARACEAVLNDPDEAIEAITFDDTIKGRFMRRGPRLALAFIAQQDADIADNAVGLVLEEGGALDNITVTLGSCTDTLGADLDGVQIAINDLR